MLRSVNYVLVTINIMKELINDRFCSVLSFLISVGKVESDAEFADKTGLTAQHISDMKAGRRSVTPKTINKIIDVFPEISFEWFYRGKGLMLNTLGGADNEDTSLVKEETKKYGKTSGGEVRLLPMRLQAGSLAEFFESANVYNCELIKSPIDGADFAMTVAGDSMMPKYPEGAYVFIKRVNEKVFIEWGETYVLDTINGSVIKCIYPVEDNPAKIKCVSLNEKYPPFEVYLSDIIGFYRVLLVVFRD